MRKTAVLFLCVLSSPPALAQVQDCAQYSGADRDACMQARFEPTPEQAAREREGRRATVAYHTRIAPMLAASEQPRELALAATLQRIADWSDDDAQAPAPGSATGRSVESRAGAWQREATAVADDDVIAWTLLLQDDAATRSEAAARWQALEPDNLAAWLAGNPTADALFAAAGRATHYDHHFYPRVRWIAEALRAHPPTAAEAQALMGSGPQATTAFDPNEFAVMAAMGIDMALAMPALGTLMDGCREAALAVARSRREDCRHVASLLLDDPDSVLMENVGIGLLDALARTDAERATAAERRRRFDWRMQQRMRLEMGGGASAGDDFLRLFGDPTIDNERELIQRLLREADVPLQPPADWVAPSPYG